jgi:hypothetical protein
LFLRAKPNSPNRICRYDVGYLDHGVFLLPGLCRNHDPVGCRRRRLLRFIFGEDSGVFVLLYISCLAAFIRCCRSSPGIINKSNVAVCLDQYVYDGILFRSGDACRTCRIAKFVIEM